MTDLTPIINALIALTAALITAFVIPWLRRNTDARDREELLKWVEIAVAGEGNPLPGRSYGGNL